MKKIHWLALLLALVGAPALVAQNATPTSKGPSIAALRTNPTNWVARHEGFIREAKRGGIGLLFMGDSITDNWRNRGSGVWNKYYGSRHAANFGIGGDRTQHVLWRIDHGELDGLNPKVIVLMIGTNNSNSDGPEPIADAIKLIIAKMRAKCPDSKVLLLAVFPRNKPSDKPEQMETIHRINSIIAGFDDGKMVRFLDINSKFLGPDGKVPADIMPDFLHPNEKGYQLWAEAMEPRLSEMMK